MNRWQLLWHRLRYRLIASSRPRYSVRYRDFVSAPEFTFSEALKMSRAIPPKHRMEIMLPGGAVHFTCPPRPIPEDLQKELQK